MYDNNGYQPTYNFSTDPNNNQQPQPPQPPKKKKTSTGLVVGLIIASIVVGGASGFGGAYLSSRINSELDAPSTSGVEPNRPDDDNDDINASETTPITTPEYVKPEVEVSDDLSSLENMANVNITRTYSYEELYEAVNESVVVVNNYVQASSIYMNSSSEFVKQGTGSGVLFTTDGYIVTNYHVISGADRISVIVSDRYGEDQEMEAIVVGSDNATDLAVLKIGRDQSFIAAPLGNSDSLKIGQNVAAIGNPAGLNKSLTGGYISGLNRYSNEKGYELSSIQTDAAINPGNSGGGLFDMYGNLIGVVNSKLVASDSSIENLGFAITINEAKPVISDLINFGHVTGRPALGISTQQINQYTAQLYGLSATGLLVAEIDQDAPVAQSGLQIGDVIVKVNGIDVETVTDVQTITKGLKAGDKVTVTVSRTSVTDNGSYWGSIRTSREIDIEVILTESK